MDANGTPQGFISGKSIALKLPSEYQSLIEQAVWISIRYTFQLNPTVYDDVQIIKPLVEI